jgi:hypothetical protein
VKGKNQRPLTAHIMDPVRPGKLFFVSARTSKRDHHHHQELHQLAFLVFFEILKRYCEELRY